MGNPYFGRSVIRDNKGGLRVNSYKKILPNEQYLTHNHAIIYTQILRVRVKYAKYQAYFRSSKPRQRNF